MAHHHLHAVRGGGDAGIPKTRRPPSAAADQTSSSPRSLRRVVSGRPVVPDTGIMTGDPSTTLVRHVESHLVADVAGPALLAIEVSVAGADPAQVEELLDVRLDGTRIRADALPATEGGRVHRVEAGAGRLTVDYRATITGRAAPALASPSDRLQF